MNAIRTISMSGLVLAIGALGLGTGCGEPGARAIRSGPTMVVVSTPLEQEVLDFAYAEGHTDAAMSVDLRARVTGYLAGVNFKVGQEVQQDQLLFQIDPRQYQAAMEQAQAAVLSFEASVKRAEADFLRAEKLLPKGAISQEEYDKIAATRSESRAGLISAKAKVDEATLNVEFTRITAPFAGKIGRNLIDIGNVVSANTTELANIVAVDPVFVYFNMNERDMLRVQKMLFEGKIQGSKDTTFPVMVQLADEKDYTHEATVNFVDNRVDSSTGTIQLRAVLPNPIIAQDRRKFIAGLFVRVRVPVGEPYKALAVREAALMTQQGQKYLYVVDDKNAVVYRPVKLGTLHNGLRVIEEGLNPGERVIVSGLQMVRPGVVVDPKPGSMRPELAQASADPQPVKAASPATATK